MRVVIQGAGHAGLTLAIALRRRLGGGNKAVSIHVIEAREQETIPSISRSMEHVGLWTPSLYFLNQLGVYDVIHSDIAFVGSSCYKSPDGITLAAPTKGVTLWHGVDKNQPALGFIKKSILIETLTRIAVDTGVTFSYGTTVTHIKRNDDRSLLISTPRESRTADLLVGADGMLSGVKRLLGGNEGSVALHRGYKVYRGSSAHSDAGPSFQIWGEGMRFARVPITSGSYWFAAITSPPVDKAGCSSLSQEGISSEEWDALLARLRDMSEPVRSILTQTLGGHRGVLLDQTYATGKLTTNSGSSSTTFGSVALIGDANFTGAGMAIEDAYILAQELGTINEFKQIPDAIDRFHQQRYTRRRTLQILADISQSIGHIDNPSLGLIRNAVISRVPQFVKGRIFDYIIDQSISYV